mgnify:CR=1 FL=1
MLISSYLFGLMVLCIVSHPTALFRHAIIWHNQQNLCQNTLFYFQQPMSTNTTFFNTCIIVSFQSFLAYYIREFNILTLTWVLNVWHHQILCVIWRHAFRCSSDDCKQTWKVSFWGMPLTCEHDVTFRHSHSGKRLSKALYYEVNVLNNGQSWLV